MPLFWEKIRAYEKMFWVAMLFIFLAVEYRAIDREHRDNLEAQKRALETIGRGFSDVLSEQQASFSELVHQSQEQFQNTLQQQGQQFRATMKRFTEVTGQQVALSRKQQEMIDSANGHLLPGDELTPSLQELGCGYMNQANITADDYFIRTGPMTHIVHEFPFDPLHVVTLVKGKNKLGLMHTFLHINKGEDGRLVLALDVRDKDGSIIVKFDEDGFEVGPQFLKRHPDKSTLIVTDNNGKEVLKAVYANSHYLRLRAEVIVNGETVADTSQMPHLCLPGSRGGGGSITVVPPI